MEAVNRFIPMDSFRPSDEAHPGGGTLDWLLRWRSLVRLSGVALRALKAQEDTGATTGAASGARSPEEKRRLPRRTSGRSST